MRTSLFMAIFLAYPVASLAGDPNAEVITHRIIPGWVQADGTHMAGLEITLAPGWKTYWRSPGDAGIPPTFNWAGADNLSGVRVHWPSPQVFWQSGMRSVGYDQRVVLPLTISPEQSGAEVRLRGSVNLGICSDICVPAHIDIDAILPPEADTKAPAIVAAIAAQPYSAKEASVSAARCRLTPTRDGMQVQADIDMPSSGGTEQAVIETSDPAIWVGEPTTARQGERLTIHAEMMHNYGGPMMIDRSDLRITVIGGSYSVDIKGCTG